MSSMQSASSNGGNHNLPNILPNIRCPDCGIDVKMMVSNSAFNPGKFYYVCPNNTTAVRPQLLLVAVSYKVSMCRSLIWLCQLNCRILNDLDCLSLFHQLKLPLSQPFITSC